MPPLLARAQARRRPLCMTQLGPSKYSRREVSCISAPAQSLKIDCKAVAEHCAPLLGLLSDGHLSSGQYSHTSSFAGKRRAQLAFEPDWLLQSCPRLLFILCLLQ